MLFQLCQQVIAVQAMMPDSVDFLFFLAIQGSYRTATIEFADMSDATRCMLLLDIHPKIRPCLIMHMH